MRIIAGKYGGQQLKTVPEEIRPTTDRLREALFSSLGESVEGSRWLDLFAGSGAVGIEAFSRGAEYVHFNDRAFEARRVLARNLDSCGIESGFQITGLDAFRCLRQVEGEAGFSHLFLDPPYDFGRHEKLIRKAMISPAVRGADTLWILEVFKKANLGFLQQDEFETVRRLTAGDSVQVIFRLKEGR